MGQFLFVLASLSLLVYLCLFIYFILQKQNYVSIGNYFVQLIGLLTGLLHLVSAFAIGYGSSDLFLNYGSFICLSSTFIFHSTLKIYLEFC